VSWRFVSWGYDDSDIVWMVFVVISDVRLSTPLNDRRHRPITSPTPMGHMDVDNVLPLSGYSDMRTGTDDVSPLRGHIAERYLRVVGMFDSRHQPVRAYVITLRMDRIDRDCVPIVKRLINRIDASIAPFVVLLFAATAAVYLLRELDVKQSPSPQRRFDVGSRCLVRGLTRPFSSVIRRCVVCHVFVRV
jgi:hypothetical protein